MSKNTKVKNLSELLTPDVTPLGPSPAEIEKALTLKDPVDRAFRIQQMMNLWKQNGPDHGFTSDGEFISFLEDNSKSCASDLMVCLRETIKIIQDRLTYPEEIQTKELISLLSELGRQLKVITASSKSTPEKTEKELDEELEALEKEVGADLDDL